MRPTTWRPASAIFSVCSPRKGYTQDECDLLSLAIYYRMVALAELVERGDTRGWTLPDAKPGAHSLDADLVQAAAEEPLIEGADGHPAFDKATTRTADRRRPR